MSQGVSTKQERDRALELLTTLDDIPLHTVRDTNAESLKLRNTITVDPQGACQAVLEAARLRRPDLLEKLMVLGASPFSRDANNRTALENSCLARDADCVIKLLQPRLHPDQIPEFYWRPALRLLRDSLEDYARYKMTLRPNPETTALEGPMLERCVFLINRVQSLMHNLGWLVEYSAQRGSPAGMKLLDALTLSSMLTLHSNEAPLLALLRHLVPE
eukprot:TRINITY_DN1226_c0_g1_i2.p1 TRINITY_DN1226_c0_g1~~TRINITY_DN1226_c0_g1_i2.p1  ORF type:complete len:217 (-),score=11.82 TRINITY_DN1226_c0_g1_i2:1071-1721(-)